MFILRRLTDCLAILRLIRAGGFRKIVEHRFVRYEPFKGLRLELNAKLLFNDGQQCDGHHRVPSLHGFAEAISSLLNSGSTDEKYLVRRARVSFIRELLNLKINRRPLGIELLPGDREAPGGGSFQQFRKKVPQRPVSRRDGEIEICRLGAELPENVKE